MAIIAYDGYLGPIEGAAYSRFIKCEVFLDSVVLISIFAHSDT